jgi:hypothetical protein
MNISPEFRPKLLDTLKDYTRAAFRADLIAGVTVGIVALPLAMAFAIASGVPPQAGIFTAVIAGIIVSGLGGTKVSIGGPTGAFIVILYGIYAKYGAENLAVCTIMAGVILIILGVARMGTVIKYIPYPVTAGFTSGIADPDLQHTNQGFFRTGDWEDSLRFHRQDESVRGKHRDVSMANAPAGCRLVWGNYFLAGQMAAPCARLHCRACPGHRCRCHVSSASGNDRFAIWRDSAWSACAALSSAGVGQHSSPVPTGDDHCAPGRN